jgi:crotonobetainyl-CoA:carnitine CoA-transferase CaiB-like acyl-CoA transferase
MWAAIGILAALHRRRDTGRGGVVDVSLFETSTAFMSLIAAQYLASTELPRKMGSGTTGIVPYRAYRTADGGDLVIAAGNDALFARFCAVLDREAWTRDPRFATNPDRVRNQTALYALIEPLIEARPTAEWIAALDTAGVPCAPVQNVQQMLDHEQTRALGLLQPMPRGDMCLLGLPVSFDGERPAPRRAPPALGEHTDRLLGCEDHQP